MILGMLLIHKKVFLCINSLENAFPKENAVQMLIREYFLAEIL